MPLDHLPPAVQPPVQIQACPHPFTTDYADHQVPAGLTISEILRIVQPDPALLMNAHVYVGEHYIKRQNWHLVRPNPGVKVLVRVVPQDSDEKNPLATILQIAVIAAALVIPAMLPAAFVNATIVGTLTVGQALTAGIAIAGSLAVAALVPPPSQNLGRLSGTDLNESPAVFISGARNAARPFGVVPRQLGTFRSFPPLAANTFTEVVGDDEYLRLPVSWGLGPIHFQPFKIADTLLSEFDEVEQEHRRGFHPNLLTDRGAWDASTGAFPLDPSFGDRYSVSVAGTVAGENFEVGDSIVYHGIVDAISSTGWDQNADKPFKLYADDPAQTPLSVDLEVGAGRSVQTSLSNVDELSVDITFPLGLVNFSDDGSRHPWTVQVLVEYSPVGQGQWTTAGTIQARAKTTSAVRRGFRWSVPNGQWDVALTKLTSNPNPREVVDTVQWTALRSIRSVDPFGMLGEARSVFRIKATGQLHGIVDRLNSVTTSIVKDWDSVGQVWRYAPSNNPASLYRAVLQDHGNARARADSEIDEVTLEGWHEKNTAAGYTFNQIIDYRIAVLALCRDIASAGRAAPTRRGKKWSVAIDEANKPIVGHFTPRNTWGFSGEIAYPKLPHGFRVRFNNEQVGYEADERIVYDDGFDESNATEFEELQLVGITDPELVWRHARFHIAQARLRRETFSFNADIEHIICTRGDRSFISHDVMLVVLASGRISELTVDGSNNVTAIAVDEELVMQAGKTYGLVVRTEENAALSVPITTVDGVHKQVTPVTPVPAAQKLAVDDLFSFGELGQEGLDIQITAIEPGRDNSARIFATAYAPDVHLADQGAIPPFQSGITPTVSILAPVPLTVRSDGPVLLRDPDGSWQSRILVSLLRLSGLQQSIREVEARFRETDSDTAWIFVPPVDVDQGEISLMPVEDGAEYVFQLRWVLANGERANWSPETTHLVEGKTADPSDVTGFIVQQNGSAVTARWDQIPDRDRDGYTLRYGQPAAPWDTAFSLTQIARGTQVATLEIPPGTWDVMIKAVDTSGNESAIEARVRLTVVSTFDEIDAAAQAPSWPGLHPRAVELAFEANEAAEWNQGSLENATIAGDGFLQITV